MIRFRGKIVTVEYMSVLIYLKSSAKPFALLNRQRSSLKHFKGAECSDGWRSAITHVNTPD